MTTNPALTNEKLEWSAATPETRMIKVWHFQDAPKEYQDLSTNGGDEEWLAFVPDALKNEGIFWMEEGGPFGCFAVDEFPVSGGIVCIGCHS